MTTNPTGDEVAALVEAGGRGDRAALDRAFALLHEELSALEHLQRRSWEADATIDTKALVHDAWLKLAPSRPASGGTERSGRQHFFECRFSAGMTIEETAEALGASPATVERVRSAARDWLRRELGGWHGGRELRERPGPD